MKELAKFAAYDLADGEMSQFEAGRKLNEIPMSALKAGGSEYGFSRDAFNALAGRQIRLSGGPAGAVRNHCRGGFTARGSASRRCQTPQFGDARGT